ncbi:hypothetical protein BHM03_00019560, partial [Ensete ventricosum]
AICRLARYELRGGSFPRLAMLPLLLSPRRALPLHSCVRIEECVLLEELPLDLETSMPSRFKVEEASDCVPGHDGNRTGQQRRKGAPYVVVSHLLVYCLSNLAVG